MSWKVRTALRPSDAPSILDEAFHAARFGTMINPRDGRAELNLNLPTHQAIDLHRSVQLSAVAGLSRATNAVVVVESTGELADDGSGSFTIVVSIG